MIKHKSKLQSDLLNLTATTPDNCPDNAVQEAKNWIAEDISRKQLLYEEF